MKTKSFKYMLFNPNDFRTGVIITRLGTTPYGLRFKDSKLISYLYLAYDMEDFNSINEAIKLFRDNSGLKNAKYYLDNNNVIDLVKTISSKELILLKP